MQAQQFKDRESQYNHLAREYREKLESVKFERERIALKEEQFLRQIQKAESQSKQDVKRHIDKHESQMHSRKRDFERKIEELEERVGNLAEESDTSNRKNERLTRENQDLKR